MATRIKFNSKAFRTILVGDGTRAAVNEVAGRYLSALGGRARTGTIIGNYGGGRVVAFVATRPRNAREATELREQLEAAVVGGA